MNFLSNWLTPLTSSGLTLGLTSLTMLFSANTFAAEELDQSAISGKAIFAKYGISDDLPKLGLSSLMQGEHLVEHVERTLTVGDDVRTSSVYLVQNTDEKGNIDLRIKYDPSKVDENDDVIKEIEKNTKIEYRLRKYAQSYDPSSVVATELDNGQVEVAFNYSQYGLPQDISYFRFMRVKLLVENGKPLKMVIKNNKPFTLGDYRMEEYRQTVSFAVLPNGRTAIKKKQITIDGFNKKQQAVSLHTNVSPVAYYDGSVDGEILDEKRLAKVSDPRYIEESVKLDRVFPLMSDMVRQQGIDVPLPFGLSMSYRNQDMNFGFTDFDIMGANLNDIFDPLQSVAEVTAETMTIRGDVNILPFWNMFGYYGKLNVDAKVDAEYTGAIGLELQDQLNNKLPGLGNAFCTGLSVLCEKGNLHVPLHLEYTLRGVGTTLSVGYKQFFASVTGTYTQTKMDGASKWSDGILTVQPMLGYQLAEYRTQFFIGAEYQALNPSMDGTIEGVELGGEEFFYNVGVDLEKWAYLVGFNKQFGKHYNLTFLYNKGETRNSMTLNFGYRF
ncbi:hypothetical protein L2735_03040 [Shewanella olleyana]|uniref:hypothetical protein n=1 Tax=Shewanella olleyana TaxID=135626 RepID=UPI00200FC65C|nr:hypothetical protein [Shewanella olleyana]MCL1065781.1 hypothetical protein [Shewanella olleyana]